MNKQNRVKAKKSIDKIVDFLHSYAYVETLIIVGLYLLFGYMIDSNDICMLNGEISYILILLAVITLFHGFENGILAVAILAVAIWYFYPVFQYVEFLVALLMTMIFSEFHYFWTQKIKNAELTANYKAEKLNELSRAFYTLKISHDQLEKNYVIKPMSIRNSIEYITNKNHELEELSETQNRKAAYYKNFLGLLEKSFNVGSATIIYKKESEDSEYINEKNSEIVSSNRAEEFTLKEVVEDYLVDKSIGRGTAIYISDALGEPTTNSDSNSAFLAAIPAMYNGKATAVLAIEKMPFMSFNREILTSISILLEYFSIEIRKKDVLALSDDIEIVEDDDFRFEFDRLQVLHKKYKVNSILLTLRIESELQAMRVYEQNQKLLRSLDMVTMVEVEGYFYIVILFPLHDKAAALGYLNRLTNSIKDPDDKEFIHMTFNLSQVEQFNNFLLEKREKNVS